MNNKISDILFFQKDGDFDQRIASLKKEWNFADFLRVQGGVEKTVSEIVSKVAEQGDKAVAEYTNKFDGVNFTASDFLVSAAEIKSAFDSLNKSLLKSLRGAIENVKKYQSDICIANRPVPNGIKYNPVARAALCIPGASAPLPSTVIMTAVPAMVAGVKEIIVLSPPRYNGSVHPVILALCYELGIKKVYRISGAQAVAAAAWGTKTIKKVDMIVGPGNNYVQMAKKQVYGLVKIDSFAGPSDVIIIADDNAKPEFVAADMLSQAEHAPGAALLITDSKKLAEKVIDELDVQVQKLSRSQMTVKCLLEHSAVIVMNNMDAVIDLANDFAAEHLQIQCGQNSPAIEKRITNAGAIFIGENTPVAVGDYWAGPSHTLPTRCTTKFFSALTANDFLKSSSIIEYSKPQLTAAAEHIIKIAQTEGLDAHANSVKIRIDKK